MGQRESREAVALTEDEGLAERQRKRRLVNCAVALGVVYALIAVCACVWWAVQTMIPLRADASAGSHAVASASNGSPGGAVIFRSSSTGGGGADSVVTSSVADDEQQNWILNLPETWKKKHVERFKTRVEDYGNMQCDEIKGELKAVRLLASRSWVDKIVAKFPDIEFAEVDQAVQVVEPVEKGAEQEDDGAVGNWGLPARRLQGDAWQHLKDECARGNCVENNPPWGIGSLDPENSWFALSWAMGRNVHIYVMDTGIRTTHEDFNQVTLDKGWDSGISRAVPTLEVQDGTLRVCDPNDRSCANDHHGHGTHCAATAAGLRYGVAKFATVHAVKILKDDGSGTTWPFLQALDWVRANGIRPAVASASLSGPGTSPSVDRSINAAVNAGVVIVVAAGNNGEEASKYFPGNVRNAICVGAIQEGNSRAGYSNYGGAVDIFAPGSDVRSASPSSDSSVQSMSGTSQATPHVAGTAALLLWEQPEMSPADVLQRLTSTATQGVVSNAGGGSPNLLLHYEFSEVTPNYDKFKHMWSRAGGFASGPTPKAEGELWAELAESDGKQCVDWSSVPADEQYVVDGQMGCQYKAMEHGNVYYQFSTDTGRCATSFDCFDPQTATSGPWKVYWEGGESERGGVIFDCWAGFGEWHTGWSDEKKEQCCRRRGMGCSGASGQGPPRAALGLAGLILAMCAPWP
jgi:subtilisin family serine protease